MEISTAITSMQTSFLGAEPATASAACKSKGGEDAKLKEACQQFEAVLWRSILEKSNTTTGLGPEGESGDKTGTYQYFINNTIADSVSGGGNSLGAMLYEQLSRHLQSAAKETR